MAAAWTGRQEEDAQGEGHGSNVNCPGLEERAAQEIWEALLEKIAW